GTRSEVRGRRSATLGWWVGAICRTSYLRPLVRRMAEHDEWLTPVLESLVEAARDQPGYSRDDLDRLIPLFTAFAQGATDPARREDETTVIQVGENLTQALEEVARAEKNPASSLWDEALACWHDAAVLLTPLAAQGRVPLADAAGRL